MKIYTFLLLFLFLVSCENMDKSKNNLNYVNNSSEVHVNEKQAVSVAVDFCIWYQKIHKKLNQDNLVIFNKEEQKWQYNNLHAMFYIDSFKATNLISEQMLNNIKTILHDVESDLNNNIYSSEEEYPGFVADIIFNSQDFYLPNDINEYNTNSISIENNEAEVKFHCGVIIYLVKENYKWKIKGVL